jgi:endonuclease/exonuclease/phosphatase (EEP) superfamily protein YafD
VPAKKLKPQKPPRSYRAVIESLRQVWSIELLADPVALWRIGSCEIPHFENRRIRLAIWNLCKGAGGRLFEHDYRMICFRSDLILTQEALLSEKALATFCEPGFEAVHAASYKRRDGIRDGVMTVARVCSTPIIRRIVCKYPEPVFKTPKVALVTFYQLAGASHPLMVVNLHATLIRRVKLALEEMEHLIGSLPTHEGPMILAGDFNTFTPGYLRVISKALAAIGLKHVPIPADPRPAVGALDQLFVRGLDVERIYVDTTVKNSDHFPIFADLVVA